MSGLRGKATVVLWLAAAATAVVSAAGAGSELTRVTLASGAVSMDQAVQMVEQRYHARVVKAQTQKEEGRTVYVLRLLDDSGKVWTVRVNAANGTVL